MFFSCSIRFLLKFDGDFLPGACSVHQGGDEKAAEGTSFKNDKRINKIHNEPPVWTGM